MSTEEKRNPDNKNGNEKEPPKEKSALDKELSQTVPASDPPSQTRPGSERDEDNEEKKS